MGRPPSASIGTLIDEEPSPLPVGTLKQSWRDSFGSRDGFGAPRAHRRRAVRRLTGITMLTVALLSVLAACGLLAVSCQPNDVGFAAADVVVTNHSTTTADYVVAVEFSNAIGHRAGTGYVTVDDVDPGASSPSLLASSFKPAPEGGYSCHLAQVTRLTY